MNDNLRCLDKLLEAGRLVSIKSRWRIDILRRGRIEWHLLNVEDIMDSSRLKLMFNKSLAPFPTEPFFINHLFCAISRTVLVRNLRPHRIDLG